MSIKECVALDNKVNRGILPRHLWFTTRAKIFLYMLNKYSYQRMSWGVFGQLFSRQAGDSCVIHYDNFKLVIDRWIVRITALNDFSHTYRVCLVFFDVLEPFLNMSIENDESNFATCIAEMKVEAILRYSFFKVLLPLGFSGNSTFDRPTPAITLN